MSLIGIIASQNYPRVATPPVAGYSLWLDGADASQFTFSSGSVVSSWLDKSGNAYNFSNVTVSKQPVRTSDLVVFDGINDFLQAGSKFMDNMHNGGSNTFFLVFKFNASVVGGVFDTGVNAGSDIGWGMLSYNASRNRVIVNNGSSAAVNADNNTQAAQGTLACITLRLDANNSPAADRLFFYLNTGAAQNTNTSNNSVSGSASSYNPIIGDLGNGGGGAAGSISIGEILWYSSDLSTVDREATRDYLITKWGI
jgi:hypothetical protein